MMDECDLKPNMEKWGLKKRVYFLLTQDEQNRDDKSELVRENNCQIRLLIQGKKKQVLMKGKRS